MYKNMKKKAKTAALSQEFENFLADFDSLLHATADLSGEELKEMKAKLHERVEEAREYVEHAGEDLERRARDSASEINREVHDEPWKAIGVGAALGLLLGLVVSRR
jgi:ElaB/YqjD/DUF883 family membrane-anchored ribosome-binding protein